jgi:hypothetical protein
MPLSRLLHAVVLALAVVGCGSGGGLVRDVVAREDATEDGTPIYDAVPPEHEKDAPSWDDADARAPTDGAADALLADAAGADVAAPPATLLDLWEGRAHLGNPTLVTFTGNPRDRIFQGTARIAVTTSLEGTLLAYFRQLAVGGTGIQYEILYSESTDDGLTFAIVPDAIISPGAIPGLVGAYDPDVLRRPEGYYLAFEGVADGCAFSSYLAFSVDGRTDWQVKGAPVCCQQWDASASTPNLFETPGGALYLQWVNVDQVAALTSHHQVPLGADPFATVTTDVFSGALLQSPEGSWDDRNFGSGNVAVEDGAYYLFYEGANNYGCTPVAPETTSWWGIGLARTTTVADPGSWVHFSGNPLFMATNQTSCWISYPEIIRIGNRYYLYYDDEETYWSATGNARTIFRREVIAN